MSPDLRLAELCMARALTAPTKIEAETWRLAGSNYLVMALRDDSDTTLKWALQWMDYQARELVLLSVEGIW